MITTTWKVYYPLQQAYQFPKHSAYADDPRCRRAPSASLRRAVMKAYDGKCVRCGIMHDDMQVDHIIPWSKGGLTEFDNLQVLCRSCNMAKRDKLPHEDPYLVNESFEDVCEASVA